MSFILKSLELKNIKAHEHFIFEPAITGITAISGENGAGKSTIVDSLSWCLYGTRPSGIKNRNLIRDGVNPKEKPVSVKALIVIGGVEYSIERKIISISGTTECNVWGRKQGSTELTQVAGPAVTHVEKFIRNELGMNEKGFLTSIFIQQKQVDQIVSATPRERGIVIEELTGITSVTHAISKMNENTRALEKAASIFRIGNIDEAKERVVNQEKICKDIEKKELEVIKKFKEEKEKFSILQKEIEEQSLLVKERRLLENEVLRYSDNLLFLKKQAEDDLEYIAKHKEEMEGDSLVDLVSLKKEYDDKRKEMYSISGEVSQVKKEIDSLDKKLKKIVIQKGEFSSKEEILKELSNREKERKKLEQEFEELRNQKSMYNSEIKHSKSSLTHISGEEKSCPVCKADIEDAETLRNEIEQEIEVYNEKLKGIDKSGVEIKEKVQDIDIELKKIKSGLLAIEEEIEVNKALGDLQENLSLLEERLKKSKEDFVELEKEYDRALRIETNKKTLEAAEKRFSTAEETIKESKKEKEIREKLIEESNALSEEDFEALEKRVSEEKDKINKLSLDGREILGRKELENERLEDYRRSLLESEESMERYNEIANQIEISTSAASMLTAFKADRVEHTIPTLEFYASDFLSKFTGGKFTKLSLDDKFNTFVTTSEGSVRPVAQLSGGELSTTSIALRLGIAMLLNSSSSEKSLLILDEVLVSMDEDRSRQIMETIGSMTNSQVIFIAHNSDINSVADKTVLVKSSSSLEE